MSRLGIINGGALAGLVSMAEAIALVDAAMRALSSGQVNAPQRSIWQVDDATRLGLMPGAMAGRFGLKTVSLSLHAPDHGLPSHQGLMLVFDQATGAPLGIVDCHTLTRLRTAAASAVAARALARPESQSLAIIGCGDLAAAHVEAISLVRPIQRITVWNRDRTKADAFARTRSDVRVAQSVEQAVADADIICTLTGSPMPILQGAWLRPGQHVNLVGASIRAAREADDDVVSRGYFIADSRAHALSQAGELCHAIDQGIVGEAHLKAEIGEVLAGVKPGRTHASQITVYKSLGHVAQDLAVADAALRRAQSSDKVTMVDW